MHRLDCRILVAAALTLALAACSGPASDPADSESTANGTGEPALGADAKPPVRPRLPVEPDRREAVAVPPGQAHRAAEIARLRATPATDALAGLRRPDRPVDRENYAHYDDNPVRRAAEHPVSTFSIDVDTGSYSNVRRMLRGGRLPPEDAVRVEELINYFSYDYPVPPSADVPFGVHVEQAATPWNPATRLVQIGIQGFEPPAESIPAANLVFLVDVSGSMSSADKLPLLKNALKMLTRQLDADDRIAMVVYAGATGVVLESTPGDRHAKIVAALDRLAAGGRTNGAAGIELAYAQAQQGFIEGGINRVILATDGDFNVGTVDFEQLKDLAERKRETGIAITTLGFGTGNYNDRLMEQLADAGNGNYAYIDTLSEARKVLVDQLTSTLLTIAGDVKIQVEFNPAVVAEYRLIGYENRMLEREDFNNDAVDAGDIGAGHTVTALYEVALVGSGGERIDPLRYGSDARAATAGDRTRELGYLRLRYKKPGEASSRLIERPIADRADAEPQGRLAFAAAVAAFGQHLRGGKYLEGYALSDVHDLAAGAKGEDPFGYRGEFLQLVRLAEGFQIARN
jgi:Ca-activated chloride channel family protein